MKNNLQIFHLEIKNILKSQWYYEWLISFPISKLHIQNNTVTRLFVLGKLYCVPRRVNHGVYTLGRGIVRLLRLNILLSLNFHHECWRNFLISIRHNDCLIWSRISKTTNIQRDTVTSSLVSGKLHCVQWRWTTKSALWEVWLSGWNR